MFTRLKLLSVSLVIAAALSACAGTGPATSAPLSAGTSAASAPGSAPAAKPTATSPAPTATAVPVPKIGSIETAALMMDFSDATGKFTLRLVDITNGAAVPKHDPITFSALGTYAYLPGGQGLALVVYGNPNTPSKPELVLLDIPSWTMTSVPLSLIGWAQAMAVSADGARIAVAGYGVGMNLAIVDAAKGVALAQASVPNQVRAMSFTTDGSSLMVYVSNEDVKNGLSLGAPHALLLSADDLSTIWGTDLAGVRDAFFPGPDYQGESHEPGAGTRYLPGAAFSRVTDTLYVVHADEDRLTSVDFSSRKVAAVDIRPPLSFVERLLSLGARVAHAKVQSGTEKHIAISLDGGILYVTGMDNQFTKRDNGEWELHQRALGLKVVDAATGSEVLTLDTQADQVAVLQDGLVLLRTWTGDLPSTDIYDPAAQKIVVRYAGLYQNCVPLMQGGYVLAPSVFYTRMSDMKVYDPHSERVLGSWDMENLSPQWVSCGP